jgi:hypothetical protein
MRYLNLSKWTLAAGMALASASALPAADWRDVRSGYRDTRRDEAGIARQRDRVAADRARLYEDYRRGRRGAVDRDRAALNRDQHILDAMIRDIRHDLREDRRW